MHLIGCALSSPPSLPSSTFRSLWDFLFIYFFTKCLRQPLQGKARNFAITNLWKLMSGLQSEHQPQFDVQSRQSVTNAADTFPRCPHHIQKPLQVFVSTFTSGSFLAYLFVFYGITGNRWFRHREGTTLRKQIKVEFLFFLEDLFCLSIISGRVTSESLEWEHTGLWRRRGQLKLTMSSLLRKTVTLHS